MTSETIFVGKRFSNPLLKDHIEGLMCMILEKACSQYSLVYPCKVAN